MKNILYAIGNTPLVEIAHIKKNKNDSVKIYAKLEGQNPGGSIKDRIALMMIEEAEKSGELKRGMEILESTSGNTGIGIAMVAAIKKYPVSITMSAGVSDERKKIIRAFGAQIIETDPQKGTSGAIEKANELFSQFPGKYWMSHQHKNPNNPKAHYENTAPEIFNSLPEITHFIAGIGTFGTLSGVGQWFRDHKPDVKIIGVEPFLGEKIQGLRNMKEENPPKIYDEKMLHRKINVYPSEARAMVRRLALEEGLFVGESSGAALCAALEFSKEIESGILVVMFPDRGEKYLSTNLFL